ncbi:hypothetical protein H9L10_02130 [Phycicoccus endophyticus]|uniref:Uncharacterized protein n=1 Tax=Phycicoccus endophyticus TaxID=1690220 RepID=A0A7G9R2T3_9MICO|nr:hypothetical protein [Phycicoccus endophyticus]QNN49908.1 hypothetical protein H9L10_02130 [Phycicoccus endophyticus]
MALHNDDRSQSRLRLEGIRVRGTRGDTAAVADKYGASTLIVALPSPRRPRSASPRPVNWC